jgi:putative DNA primase/helicase
VIFDPATVPIDLRVLPRWVTWRTEERDGRPTKPPQRCDGEGYANSTDATTWCEFSDALAAVRSGEAEGMGFVLVADDDLAGGDLDGCVNEDGSVHPEAARIVGTLATYTEISPSGRGLRLFFRGRLSGGRNRGAARWGGSLEFYDHARYLTVTGARLSSSPSKIEERQTAIDAIVREFLPQPSAPAVSTQAAPVSLDDEELLERIFASRNGLELRALFEGSWDGRYPSQSEADLALVGGLAFWTGPEEARLDSLFRRSRLMRPKWDSRRGESTYGAVTIARALEGRCDFYRLPQAKPAAAGGNDRNAICVQETPRPAANEDAGVARDDAEREGPEPYEGLSHDEAIKAPLPEGERFLVDELIPIGAVGTIAGLPETHKSFLAQAIAVRCARGEGEILGRQVTRVGRAGYFWQDDSRREELERIQLFERVHSGPAGLPLWWFLNLGVVLPRDIDCLRATIQHYSLELAVLDSFYNFARGIDLKEADAEVLVAQLKSEVVDPMGCTVVIVDHMAWPTEQNRKRLRAYGGVHKGAAVRFGIYIDVEGKRLFLEARGNNLRGFRRTPAVWDQDALELHLIESGGPGEHEARIEQRAEMSLAWLVEHPGSHSTSAVRKAVGGRAEITDEALERLKARDEVRDHVRGGGTWSGQAGVARYWIAAVHADSRDIRASSQLFGTRSDEVSTGSIDDNPVPSPYRGDEVRRDEVRLHANPSSVSDSNAQPASAARASGDDLEELVERVLP